MDRVEAPEESERTGFRWLAGHPAGLLTLSLTEMWERFSYYGMRALLIFYMVASHSEGGLGFGIRRAALIYGSYTMGGYLLSIPGGFIADNFLGARRAVLVGGIAIAIGHFTLALSGAAPFFGGLTLIVLGTGLLKPNVSSMVGSLYAPGDSMRDAGFSLFYVGINLGAFVAPLVCGTFAQGIGFKMWLVSHGFNPAESWHWGFASAGVGMTLGLANYVGLEATLAGVGGPPGGPSRPWKAMAGILGATGAVLALVLVSDQVSGFAWIRYGYLGVPLALVVVLGFGKNPAGRRLAAILVFFLAATVFWAVYEQTGSTLALFGESLTNRSLPRHGLLGTLASSLSIGSPFPAAYFQSVNPAFIFVLAPLFAWLWVGLGSRQPSSPIKFVLGLVLLSLSFSVMVPASRLTQSGPVSPGWIVSALFLQTLGELCLSPVGLSVMTKLAPEGLKGLVLGIWFLAAAFGNKLAGVLAGEFTSTDAGALSHFFLVQAIWVAVAAAVLWAATPWVKRLMGGIS